MIARIFCHRMMRKRPDQEGKPSSKLKGAYTIVGRLHVCCVLYVSVIAVSLPTAVETVGCGMDMTIHQRDYKRAVGC